MLAGDYKVSTCMGKLVRMTVHFYQKENTIWCDHKIFGLRVARTISAWRDRSIPKDTGAVFHLYSSRSFMRPVWTDELRVMPNGDIVGRVLILPGWLAFDIKYFTYKRHSD